MTIEITASLRAPGFHHWRDAPEAHAYLRHPHRHVFHIRVWKPVTHLDRDVEFIAFGQEIREWLRIRYGDPMQLDGASCEQLAGVLIRAFNLSACEVLEDGENGALVQRDPVDVKSS